eukprot:TRINITY_DN12393_c0_g1_i3.p1 TRINITY_DN12393_c0_g1~~TRINITY_DN12393_c0_g1_i3.p1  ORF type:complete len:101 (-),score=28.27 TRINITY_DN12393_c0_g1_i3:49-351(-)
MIRRPPRSTLSSSSAASDVYKRQILPPRLFPVPRYPPSTTRSKSSPYPSSMSDLSLYQYLSLDPTMSVSYTHLRAHETPEHLVCRLLLEKKKKNQSDNYN